MGRGTSPLRSALWRGSPKKPAQENMDANCVSSGDLTPTRKPLSSISEACRNSDENGADALTPKGKADVGTPKGKKRGGQCLFPHVESGEGTPERQGNGKSKKAYSRHQSPAKSQPASRLQDAGAAEPWADALSGGVTTAAAPGVVSKGLPEQQSVAKQGSENANSHTPRGSRIERAIKHGADSEPVPSVRPNCNQNVSATPAKSVTRTLKYGAAQGAAAAVSSTSRALVPLPGGVRHVSQGTIEQQFNLEEDPTFWLDHNVQVLIRTRPISSSEMVSQGFSKCLKQESPHTLTWMGPPETRFTFDHVAGEIISQEKLFRVAGLPMVENCMAGYNSCMFAYGQTGSGKTHTMLGDIEHLGDRPSENRGMTPRVFEYLFSRIQLEEERRKDENLKFLTKCSFLEIYNEQITDLLEPTSTNLQMREDVRKGVYVDNLTEVEVNSVQDVIQLLSQGSANRKVAATNMNRESSRSHSVFTCIIESRWERDSMTNIRFGRLNLVDLAGSERQKSSGAEGERLKEAANINKSLSTLGLVIMILVDVANGKQRHVPYRDSKLTFLLQDSLGGNSKTTIIATVSPSSCNALETLSTLKFAQRAKLIRNTAVINEDASGDVKALRAQIQQMKEELDRLRRQSISRIPLSQDDFNPVRGSFDSWGDAHKFFGSPQVSSRKLRQMEAVVAGALRREQAAEVTTKRLASEIEQLSRLVHQREAETQSSKMVLRFREDKIRRLETLSKGLLSVDSYLADEKKTLAEELELMREKAERNPELTRFAMENIRLLDQIRSLQEFREGGERDVMLEEMSSLRDQLLEALDGKIAVDQGLVPLTTPQKKALAPELVMAARENELLRLEADNYRSEVEELRTNLSSSLDSYSKMGRQVDELQELVEKLKVELSAKGDSPVPSSMEALELANVRHLEVIGELKLQLEQSAEKSKMQTSVREELDLQLKDSLLEAQNLRSELEAMKEAFESARSLTEKLQSKESALVGAQYAAAVKQIRVETEEMAVQQSQSLTNIQEMAVLFRMKETELRSQLDDAHQMIEKLSSQEEERKSFHSVGAPNSVRAEDGSFERLQKAQEIEMRHAEEVMQLQLELESLEAVLDEERSQRQELEEKLGQFDMAGAPQPDCAQQEKATSRELELTSSVLAEERSLDLEVDSKLARLTEQLQEAEEVISKLKAAGEVRETMYFDAVSRLQLYSPDPKSTRLSAQLDHDKVVMEALENQHLHSIREFDALQGEHSKALEKLKRREERERILRRRIERLERELVKEQEVRELEREYADLEEEGALGDAERVVLEQKLENAKRELEVTRRENLQLKAEESEKDLTRCEAESETVLAIASMQSELVDLRSESEVSDKELAAAKGAVSELTSELESMRMMLIDVKDENLHVISKYESILGVKDSEIAALRKDRESATVELVDYLAEGDQALNKAWLEMEQISSGYVPFSSRCSRDSMALSRTTERRKAVEQLKQQLLHAQELAKDAEGRVRVLSETAFAMCSDQAPETPQEVHRLRRRAAEALDVLQGELDSSRQKSVELGRTATVMSAVMACLSNSVEAKESGVNSARAELMETQLVLNEKERLLSELRAAQLSEQSLLGESEEKARQLSEHLEETKRLVVAKEEAAADLGSEVCRLESSLEALERERTELVESKEKVESAALETCSALTDLKEELALSRSLLKESEAKAGEAAAAQESLSIVKEEWEAEKAGLASDLRRLETEKSVLEAEMDGLRVELEEVQSRSAELSHLVLAKESEVAKLSEENKSLSCMSVAKEKEQLSAHEASLELLRSELGQKDALLKQAECEHLESVGASEARETEREREISELKEQSEFLSSTSAKKEAELDEIRREFSILATDLQRKQFLLEEAETKLTEAGQASELLLKEKDEQIALLKEESERMSCMSVAKEDGEVAEMRRKLESLQDAIRSQERTLEEVEKQLSESVQASRSLGEEKDEAICELQAEVSRLSSMYAVKSGELSRLREELQSIQSELESKEVLLQESQSRVLQADAALEKLAGEKATIQSELESRESLLEEFRSRLGVTDAALESVSGEKSVLESRLESASIDASVFASRLCEAEESQSVLQEKVSVMEARIVDYEDREQSLMMEVEELSTARNMSEEDVIHFQNEVVELRRERDSLNLEVSTMDAQSAISERLQFIQSMCTDTDTRMASMQSEIDSLTSAKEALESEFRSIEARSVHLSLSLAEREESLAATREELEHVRMDLMDASSVPRAELAAAQSNLQAAAENIDSMSKRIDELNQSRADKESEHFLLQDRLERARVNRLESQGKLDALAVAMHEFSISEESWRNEMARFLSEIESMRFQLTEKEAEVCSLQEEKRSLETRLQCVVVEKDLALASLASLEHRSDKFESVFKCAGKDASSVSDEVELAKARAALAGAEEKVKLLVDANATMTVEWESERSRLNADKEVLQFEISRLEKPVDRSSDEPRSTSADFESGKDRFLDELKQVVKRSSAECDNLRCKLRERDTTILSVKLQLEEAMVHYKETEIEMEKTIREKDDAVSRIVELESELTSAEEEIMRRREQVELFELELENVVVRLTDSEAEWSSQREQLEHEIEDVRAEAIELESELREQLQRARDAARSESDEYAAVRKRIEESPNACGTAPACAQESCRELEECVSLSLESLAAFASAQEEVDLTKSHCEKEIATLAVGIKSLRSDLSGSLFEFPVVEIQEDVQCIIEAHRTEICSFALKVESLEIVLAESRIRISTLESALENAQEVGPKLLEGFPCVSSVNSDQAADLASACADLETTRVELEMSEAAVSQLLAAVSERDATLSVLESSMNETQERLAEIEADRESLRQESAAAKLALVDVDQMRSQVLGLQRQVAQKEELIKGLEYDINILEETGSADAESASRSIAQLQKDLDEKSEEFRNLQERTATLESEVCAKLEASDAAIATAARVENTALRAQVAGLESRLFSLDAVAKEEELVVTSLKSELAAARSESEANAARARQSAEVFKTYAESRAEEMMANEQRLKMRVSGLEDQVTVLEKKVEEQCELREQVEKELRKARQLGSTFLALESREAQPAKQSSERKLRVVEADLSISHQRRESLQSQCDEKDRQVKGLESLMEIGSVKSLSRTSSMGPCMDFRSADVTARRRIEELEAVAAGRLKEVYRLNAKIAELESVLHDVVRGLVRCNLDVQNMKLNHPEVQEIVASVRRQSIEKQRTDTVQDAELERLRKKLNEFIGERDSWLEEITRQQAEIVAARASAEKMRFRDDTLTADNEKLKTQCAGLQKRLLELEQEIKKLSGQQNLQQRIHHHAKIKDENNSLRLQVEDLSTKMRRAEMMFGRVKAEVERYRIAAGKAPFPDIDEEQRLRSQLQEAEESKIQLAQQFITLSVAIQQAAGHANSVSQVDESAAMDAVRQLESRLRTAEDEVSECRLKTRISGEKRRLSELRTFHTPAKSNPAAASQPFLSSPAVYR